MFLVCWNFCWMLLIVEWVGVVGDFVEVGGDGGRGVNFVV